MSSAANPRRHVKSLRQSVTFQNSFLTRLRIPRFDRAVAYPKTGNIPWVTRSQRASTPEACRVSRRRGGKLAGNVKFPSVRLESVSKINYLTADVASSRGAHLSSVCFCLSRSFLAAPFPPDTPSRFLEPSPRIQTGFHVDGHPPSTSEAPHFASGRRATRRMFENVFSPSRPFQPLASRRLLARHPFVTDGNLATDLLPEMLTELSRVAANAVES